MWDKFNMDKICTGMLVVTRDGDVYMAMRGMRIKPYDKDMEDVFIRVNKHEFTPRVTKMSDYDKRTGIAAQDTLGSDYDVMGVYEPYCYPDLSEIENEIRESNLVWKREKPKELTVKQISELLGYEVKVIKED